MATGRPRNTTRQREAGAASRAETRRRLEVAAAELFAERGYTATTVTAIAGRAGVSLQTLYLACGSKAALLRSALEQALSGTSAGVDAAYVPRLQAQLASAAVPPSAEEFPEEQVVRGFARVFRTIAERAAPWWRTYRDAAAVDSEIAAEWAELNRARRATTAKLLTALTAVRPDTDSEQLVDTAWTVASPETCDLLVRQAGYTFDAYERWLGDTLVAVLLQRPQPASRAVDR